MPYTKAEIGPRILAALVDAIIAAIPFYIPIIGPLVSTAYILTKDGLMYQITGREEWKNRSIGKKLFNLQIVPPEGELVDLAVSAKRNLPLAIGSIIAIVPVLGWAVGPIVGLACGVIEIGLVLTDDKGCRLGDRWADTMVIGQPVKSETSI
ncbi:MAG: RDD family protein [Halanaerobium sp.]|nr:RDD family protein [Halanaerobium sp.]